MPFYKNTKFFLFFFLWFHLVSSQKYPGKNYTSANELPNNSVRSLLIDSNNVLWIGTENGVVKKENDDLKYFFEEDGLALNSCWAIAEDSNNRIWFGSYGEGVSIYDGYRFHVISREEGLIHNEVTKLFSHGNSMYVGTSDGVSVIDINTFEVAALKDPVSAQLFRVQDFFLHEEKVFVTTYNSGIFQISQDNLPKLVPVNDHKFIYSVFVEGDSIYSSNKGFYTKSPLSEYISEQDAVTSEEFGTSIIWDHVKTNDGRIFAAAWGIYDTNGGIYEIKNDGMISRASEFNVPSKEVISLAYDPNFEKLYAGTKDAGLFEISLDPQIQFHALDKKSVLGFAETPNSSAILVDDGLLLKASDMEHHISLQQLKLWQSTYLMTTPLELPKHRDDFYELQYATPAEDIGFYDLKVSGNAYRLNTNIGIFAITESGELLRYLPLHSEEISFTPDGKLIETNPYGGVRVYSDPDALEYRYFDPDAPHTPTMVVNSLQKGGKTYLLSIFSGLYVWENGRFRSYLQDGLWTEKKLKHITELGDDLAISNEFGDIFIVNADAAFRIKEKIPRAAFHGNSISFLNAYQGTLIIGTEKGITFYKDGRYIFMDQEQGLEQPLLSSRVHQSHLSVGSRNGFFSIDLHAISNPEPRVAQLNLQEIFINNSAVSHQHAQEDKLKLANDENTVLLKFSTNAHPYPGKLKYQYRLESEGNWSLPSSTPEIFLASLPTREYDIAVKVLDESTGLSYSQSLLRLEVLPPFWKTWWFALLLLLLLGLTVYGFYRIQILQARKFEEQKGLIQKRFEETKMEALLAQMNPHFIFNAMNSIQYYIMENDIDNASNFLRDFGKLIRLNLDHCTKPTILLIEEIEYLQSYIRVENTRFNNAIEVNIDIDPSIDVYNVEIPTMLLQSFVENVFVHAFPTRVQNPILKISFHQVSDEVLQCRIEDNGIGFTHDSHRSLHTSKGVSLVRERLALLGYEVEEAVQIFSKKNKGTTVQLRLQV